MKNSPWPTSAAALCATLTAAVLGVHAPAAWSFSLDTDNPELRVRWDNSLRYNLGIRARDCDPDICGNGAGLGGVTAYQSDRKFADAGDVVTNRIDLLSEFDLVYRRDHGFRVSAAGWFDAAYSNRIERDSALDASGVGLGAGPTGGAYAGYTKRWNRGPSGGLLDAFVFTKVDIGDVPVNIRLGQHNIYWGEPRCSLRSEGRPTTRGRSTFARVWPIQAWRPKRSSSR